MSFNIVSLSYAGQYALNRLSVTIYALDRAWSEFYPDFVRNLHIMTEPAAIEFSDIQSLLKSAGVASEAAEAHGEFCGRACLAGAAAIRPWQAGITADAEVAETNVLLHECSRALESLAVDSLLKLEAGDMRFNLLLPDDGESIDFRAAALADWCHGFMHGLVIGGGADQGPQADALESVTASEILDDFSEITKAGAIAEEGEGAERAYVELVEYVRVSAQLMYDETAELRSQGQTAVGEQ
ncbi:MAG: UPF0149 family protein [Gammaproteobacteria bacterium]|jgi:uncharacterized protein YgfB (UPF0149 family)